MSATVGVIGGMGPAATLDFMARVLALTPVAREQDHLHLIVDSDPAIPDRNAALAGTGLSPASVLAGMGRRLEAAGAHLLAMPCNTAHAFAPAIRRATAIPFVDMIEATVDAALAQDRRASVGLLAADGCLATGLYQDAFAAADVEALRLSDGHQRRFMDLLYRIKLGDTGAAAREEMAGFAHILADAGAERVIAACTEVPLVLTAAEAELPLIVSTDALAAAVVDRARRGL